MRETGRFRLTGHGDINTYAVFAETARNVVSPSGRCGMVLPTGIGTDATTAQFFSDVVKKSALVAFLEFENEAWLLSRAVHHSFRFCLLSMTGSGHKVREVSVAFGVRYIADLPERRLRVRPRDLLLVNPNTGTMPLFRSPLDARITLDIYGRVPVLWRDDTDENPWGISFMAMFHMANDSRLFRTDEELRHDGWRLDGNVFVKGDKRMLPLYEAKMIHHFDHRYGTYEGQTEAQANVGTLPRPTLEEKRDPSYVIMPRYWVQEWSELDERRSRPGKPVYDPAGVDKRLESRSWDRGWLLGWRDIARSTDERTMISGVLPQTGIGHTFPLIFTRGVLPRSTPTCPPSCLTMLSARRSQAHTSPTVTSPSSRYCRPMRTIGPPHGTARVGSRTGSKRGSWSSPTPRGIWRISRATLGTTTARPSSGTRNAGSRCEPS